MNWHDKRFLLPLRTHTELLDLHTTQFCLQFPKLCYPSPAVNGTCCRNLSLMLPKYTLIAYLQRFDIGMLLPQTLNQRN